MGRAVRSLSGIWQHFQELLGSVSPAVPGPVSMYSFGFLFARARRLGDGITVSLTERVSRDGVESVYVMWNLAALVQFRVMVVALLYSIFCNESIPIRCLCALLAL